MMSIPEQLKQPGLFSADAASEELYSRLANLEAARRADLEVTRQVSRSGVWYVIHDVVTFKHHRVSAADYQIFAAIQQGMTLGQCFQRLQRQGVLTAHDGEKFYAWVVQLNRLGLISLPIDTGHILHTRSAEKITAGRRAQLAGILFHRMPLWSPDAFLRRTIPAVAPLFTKIAVLLWAVAMAISCIFVAQHARELADPFQYATATQSATLMAVLLVILKGVHEMGHAWACRYFGGRVPEMGMFFIVFTPCAYVDASDSWSFPQRHRRIAVALAGMYFESIAAMGALVLWSFSDPGLLKAAAHQALMLATVVTIGFNINPLMKFDGYYVLADLLGMPELRNDGIAEWKRYVKRFFYGIKTPSLGSSRRESMGLAFFGFAVSIYKLTVIVGISILIAGLPLIGLPLGLIFFVSFFWQLLGKFVQFTMSSRELDGRRARALSVAMCGFFGGVGLLFHVPSPRMTTAYGVIHHEFQETLHATGNGRLQTVAARHGDVVHSGQSICELSSEVVDAEVSRRSAMLVESRLQSRLLIGEDPAAYLMQIQREEQIQSRFEEVRREQQALATVAPISGRVFTAPILQTPGGWVNQGDVLAVIGHGRQVVDAVISELDAIVGLPKPGDEVQVRLESADGRLLRGVLVEIAPAARNTFAEPALTSVAAGPLEVDPQTAESELAWFSLRIVLTDESSVPVVDGVRAIVKLNSEPLPIGYTVFRSCCRLRDSFLMSK